MPTAVHFKMAVWLSLTVVSTGRCNREGAEIDCPGAPFLPGGPLGPGGPAGPCIPRTPSLPIGPCGPTGPCLPGDPAGPALPRGPGIPWGPRLPRLPVLPFWSWSTKLFIFGTELILQQTKFIFDQLFYIRGCFYQFRLRVRIG